MHPRRNKLCIFGC